MPIFQTCVFRIVRCRTAFKAGNACVVYEHIKPSVIVEDYVYASDPVSLKSNIEARVAGR